MADRQRRARWQHATLASNHRQKVYRLPFYVQKLSFHRSWTFDDKRRCRSTCAAFSLVIAVLVGACAPPSLPDSVPQATDGRETLGGSPQNTAYLFDGEPVLLQNGRAEREAAPGSATRVKTEILGEPVYGDLDGDGDEDAAVLIRQDPGGSGRFLFLAAALRDRDGWRGLNSVLLGDRVSPSGVAIRDGVVDAHFLDRQSGEPMAASPTLSRSVLAALARGELSAVKSVGKEDLLLSGWLTIGHEVRSFRACGQDAEHWLLGESETLAAVAAAYRSATRGAPPYMPVFAVLMGRGSPPPRDGFGAHYDAALDVGAFVHTWPSGHCHSDEIRVNAPHAGARVTSPLRVSGIARGSWFFEGDAPVVVLDSGGRAIGAHYISAQDEWMTRQFVPYAGSVEFQVPEKEGRGTLVLKRDNPTGREKHDRSVRIPIRFD